jgi:hypothetical protein
VPVTYGDAQISVPSDWIVMLSGGQYCASNPPGFVYLGLLTSDEGCGGVVTALPASTAELTSLKVLPSIDVHGMRVFIVDTGPGTITYDVPSLHVVVSVRGELRHQMMDTLRASPRTAVLGPGPASAAPSSWRWLTFAGIRFADPASWPVRRTNIEEVGCGPTPLTLRPGLTTTLDTDEHVFAPSCVSIGSQPPTQPVDSVEVNSDLPGYLDSGARPPVVQ